MCKLDDRSSPDQPAPSLGLTALIGVILGIILLAIQIVFTAIIK